MSRNISPWTWIPTLYIAEGLPYFAVNTLTVIMYYNLGVGLSELAFYTGWLYLPWVIKPFWSPFVDLFKTKRSWIITMQWLMGIALACVAFLLPTNFFFASTVAVFWLIAFSSATHDIAADGYYMLELSQHDQAAFVGVRSTFYRIASIIGQGGLVMLAGFLEVKTGNISLAWSIVFVTLSVFFLAVAIYHQKIIPHPAQDKPVPGVTSANVVQDFIKTFRTFFKKDYIGSALLFMLLYRLPEALCIKLVQPFMVASKTDGGLSLTTSQVGFINGTIGVVALLIGGIAGGVAISRNGLKKWLWPMALSLTLPCILYCFLAMSQTDNLFLISSAVFIEQFGYGFGFSAYMLYLIYFSQGESQTSHYAFCTAFMALGMMIPGMFAGWIFENLVNINFWNSPNSQGFTNFFWLVMLTCSATLFACSRLHISSKFGMKEKEPKNI
ncbi:MAG: MFS transporter [Muribaculaceae bacterium]|nr:MFS transporter [Muribaculaceae bacterium]